MSPANPSQRPSGLYERVFGTPEWVFTARLGFLFGHRMVMLEHTGRRSGKARRITLNVLAQDGDSYVVYSETGPGADWFRNIQAHPASGLWVRSRRYEVDQRFLTLSEAATVFARYESSNGEAAARLKNRLGLSHDGTHQGRIRALEEMPMVEFKLKSRSDSAR